MLRITTLILFFSIITVNSLFSQASATANFTASATIIQPIGITTTNNMQFANIDAQNGGAVILTPENTRITTGELILADGGLLLLQALITSRIIIREF